MLDNLGRIIVQVAAYIFLRLSISALQVACTPAEGHCNTAIPVASKGNRHVACFIDRRRRASRTRNTSVKSVSELPGAYLLIFHAQPLPYLHAMLHKPRFQSIVFTSYT